MSAPESLTFVSLVSDIQAYCERDDAVFVAQIPRFIMYAENRIASEQKPLGLQKVVSGTLNGVILVKPARWRLTRSFSYLAGDERVYLLNRGYEFCRAYWPIQSNTAAPKFYSDYDYEHFFLSPSPDAQYDFELVYYERPLPLSSDNQTSWTTQYAPQLLLYAALIEAMPFLKNSERVPEFVELYKQAMAAIVGEDKSRLTDASVAREK